MESPNNQITYLAADGENIDATLDLSVLDRRPNPEECPRWDRVLESTYGRWGQKTKGLFFPSDSPGLLPMGSVQALTAMNYSVIPLSGPVDMKVVDISLQYTMGAITNPGSGNVILASHDADFLPQVETLLNQSHRVAVMCFKEFLFSQLHELEERGLEIIDLECDVHAFQMRLPRFYIIDINDFDPMPSLQILAARS